MGNNFFVSTGTILKDYMDSHNLTQKELSQLIDSSEKHISNLVNGKVRLTEEFALKLENAFPDVKAEFWLNIERNYRLHLLRKQQKEIPNLKEIAKEYQFAHIFKGLRYNMQKQAEEMLKILGVSSFEEADHKIEELSYSFMHDDGNEKAMFTWLKLCEYEIDIQNDLDELKEYNKEALINNLGILKQLIKTTDFKLAERNIRRFLNNHGIALVIMEAIPNAKIRGATSKVDGIPVIFLSTRYKMFDTFYFTLIHEIHHQLNSDYLKDYLLTYEETDSEVLSNNFSRNFFVDEEEYNEFKKLFIGNNDVADEEIIIFANKQGVIPDVIIGFLQYDKIIKHNRYRHLRGNMW